MVPSSEDDSRESSGFWNRSNIDAFVIKEFVLNEAIDLIVRVLKISSENFAKEAGRTYLAEQ
jgi:hypothetical protein